MLETLQINQLCDDYASQNTDLIVYTTTINITCLFKYKS